MNSLIETRFPLSPYEEGIHFVIERVMDENEVIPDSWREGDSSEAEAYICGLNEDRRTEAGLNSLLAERPDFIAGVAKAISGIPRMSEQAEEYLSRRRSKHV